MATTDSGEQTPPVETAPKAEHRVWHPLGGWVPENLLKPIGCSPRMQECARTGIYWLERFPYEQPR